MAEIIEPSQYQDFTLETLTTPSGITRLNSILGTLAKNISSDGEAVRVFQGYGTPEGAVAAGIGSLYMRLDGGADTSVYRKESGSADTGWVAITAPASLPLSVANGGFGADNSAIAQGYIPYMSATGVISWLAVGTSGNVLKTQGAGANPIWSTDIRYLDLISTTAFSTVTTSGNISITNTKAYLARIFITNMSTTDAIGLRFNADSDANHYASNSTTFNQTKVTVTQSIAASTAIPAFIDIYILPQGTSSTKHVSVYGFSLGISAGGYLNFYGAWTNSADVTQFNLFRVSGGGETFTGTVYLYEIKQS